jgi:hypothetical protein
VSARTSIAWAGERFAAKRSASGAAHPLRALATAPRRLLAHTTPAGAPESTTPATCARSASARVARTAQTSARSRGAPPDAASARRARSRCCSTGAASRADPGRREADPRALTALAARSARACARGATADRAESRTEG